MSLALILKRINQILTTIRKFYADNSTDEAAETGSSDDLPRRDDRNGASSLSRLYGMHQRLWLQADPFDDLSRLWLGRDADHQHLRNGFRRPSQSRRHPRRCCLQTCSDFSEFALKFKPLAVSQIIFLVFLCLRRRTTAGRIFGLRIDSRFITADVFRRRQLLRVAASCPNYGSIVCGIRDHFHTHSRLLRRLGSAKCSPSW